MFNRRLIGLIALFFCSFEIIGENVKNRTIGEALGKQVFVLWNVRF